MTAEGIAAGQGRWNDRRGSAPEPVFWASPDTSVASRSMVGGARLARPGSGGDSVSSGTVIDHRDGFLVYRSRRLPDSANSLSAIPGAKHGPTPRTRHFRPARPPP